MKENIKNIKSLQTTVDGKDLIFNREGDVFKFNETQNFETTDGSYSYTSNVILNEKALSELEYTPLTYTEAYKEKLQDEYEAKLQNDLDKPEAKKRVRKYNQIAKKLEDYRNELFAIMHGYDHDPIQESEQVAVLSNMIILLEWILKQR